MNITETELSYSLVCSDFRKTLWEKGLEIQARFTENDVSQARRLENFQEVFEHMKGVINRSFIGSSFSFILGPITQVNETTIEQHLMHFLCAYYFHCKDQGQKVFPQFLYTPIISHIAQKRIAGGESSDFVMSSVMKDIYYPLFDFIKEKQSPPNQTSGIWLEGYKNSNGAQKELVIFREKQWKTMLPEDTGYTREFYMSNTLL